MPTGNGVLLMLIGTYEGKTIHCYHIGGKEYYVRRGREFVAAWDKRTDVVVVLAPAGHELPPGSA